MNACALELCRVRTVSGRLLGHAYDLRCARRGDECVVTHLVYGQRGLLERLGFRGEHNDTLPWSRVVELRPHEIVVLD